MLMANGQYGLTMLKTSGLVGLSPNHFEDQADLFIEKMKKSGAIDERVFSISIAMGSEQSYITFGGYHLHKFAKPNSTITWHDVAQNSNHWQL